MGSVHGGLFCCLHIARKVHMRCQVLLGMCKADNTVRNTVAEQTHTPSLPKLDTRMFVPAATGNTVRSLRGSSSR